MEVLGEGSFGCVVRPAATCKSKKRSIQEGDDTVSKLFTDKDEFNRELKAAKLVAKIDAKTDTILVPSKYCTTTLSNLTQDVVRSCEAINDISYMPGKTRVYQLLMPYGGTRLDHYVKSHNIDKKTFVTMMLPVFEGAHMFVRKKYCHQDIKSSNILVRPDGHALIIDYSLMKKLKEIYSSDNIRRLKHTYFSYPPEFKIIHGIKAGKSDDEIVEEVVKNISHYKKSYGDVILSLWGGRDAVKNIVLVMRQIPNLDVELSKVADRIDVFSIGTVFVQLEQYFEKAAGTSTVFNKLYSEVVRNMLALDPFKRISTSDLLGKIKILKVI